MKNQTVDYPYQVYKSYLAVINDFKFTSREIDVISCLLKGKIPKRIASLLWISPLTVKVHHSNIKSKLGYTDQEIIIDIIEKSGKVPYLKQRYSNVLINHTFKKSLKEVSRLIREPPSQNLKIEGTSSELKLTLLNHLNDHLQFFLKDFTDRLKLSKIPTEVKEVQDYLYVSFKESDDNFSTFVETLDFENKENYYLATFDVLQKLFPKVEFEQIILKFNEQYDAILNSTDPDSTLTSMYVTGQSKVLPTNSQESFPSEILKKMRIYYQKHLTFRRLFDTEHIELRDNYIPLSIVSRKDYQRQLRDAFLYTTNNNYEENQNMYSRLYGHTSNVCTIEDLIKHDNKLSYKRLMVGVAGIGKSLFSYHLLLSWAQKESDDEYYQWVFVVVLRNLLKDPNTPHTWFDVVVKDLYQRLDINGDDVDKHDDLKLKEYIKKANQDGKVLLILDGYDEIADAIIPVGSEENYLESIFRELLSQPHVLLTSRPYNLHGLYSYDFKGDFNAEISGFTPVNVKEYVNKFFDNSSNKGLQAGDLLQFLAANPSAEGTCCIPINAELICHAWGVKALSKQLASLSDLYQSVQFSLCVRKLFPPPPTKNIPTVANINKQSKRAMMFLDYIAHQSLCDNRLFFEINDALDYDRYFKETTLNQDELSKGEDYLSAKEQMWSEEIIKEQELYGIICPAIEINYTPLGSYYFSHLTFRDFFAARYLSDCLRREVHIGQIANLNGYIGHSWRHKDELSINDFISNFKYLDSFEMITWFITGLLAHAKDWKTLNSFIQLLSDHPKDITGFYSVLLIIRCLDEAQDYIDDANLNNELKYYYAYIGKWLGLSCNLLSGLQFKALSERLNLSRRLLRTKELESVFIEIIDTTPLDDLVKLLEHLHATLKVPTLSSILSSYFKRLRECQDYQVETIVKRCVAKLTDWSLNNQEITDEFQRHGLAVESEKNVALDSEWRLIEVDFTHWDMPDWGDLDAKKIVETLTLAFNTPFLTRLYDELVKFSRENDPRRVIAALVWGRMLGGFIVGLIEKHTISIDQIISRLELSFDCNWTQKAVNNLSDLSGITQYHTVRATTAKAWGDILCSFTRVLLTNQSNVLSDEFSSETHKINEMAERLGLAFGTKWAKCPLLHLRKLAKDSDEDVRNAVVKGSFEILSTMMVPLDDISTFNSKMLNTAADYILSISHLPFIDEILQWGTINITNSDCKAESKKIFITQGLYVLDKIVSPLTKIDNKEKEYLHNTTEYLNKIFQQQSFAKVLIKTLCQFTSDPSPLVRDAILIGMSNIFGKTIEPLGKVQIGHMTTKDFQSISDYLMKFSENIQQGSFECINKVFKKLGNDQKSSVRATFVKETFNLLSIFTMPLIKADLSNSDVLPQLKQYVLQLMKMPLITSFTRTLKQLAKDNDPLVHQAFVEGLAQISENIIAPLKENDLSEPIKIPYMITYVQTIVTLPFLKLFIHVIPAYLIKNPAETAQKSFVNIGLNLLRNFISVFWAQQHLLETKELAEKINKVEKIKFFIEHFESLTSHQSVGVRKTVLKASIDIIFNNITCFIESHKILTNISSNKTDNPLNSIFDLPWVRTSFTLLRNYINITNEEDAVHKFVLIRWRNLCGLQDNLNMRSGSNVLTYLKMKASIASILNLSETAFTTDTPLISNNRIVLDKKYLHQDLLRVRCPLAIISWVIAIVELQKHYGNVEALNTLLDTVIENDQINKFWLTSLLGVDWKNYDIWADNFNSSCYKMQGMETSGYLENYFTIHQNDDSYPTEEVIIIDLTDILYKLHLNQPVNTQLLNILLKKTPTLSLLMYVFRETSTENERQNILAVLVLRFINLVKAAYVDEEKLYYYNEQEKRYILFSIHEFSSYNLKQFLLDFAAAFKMVTKSELPDLVAESTIGHSEAIV